MRLGGIVLALGAAGCQVVFPLDGKDPLATPQIEIGDVDPAIAGIATDVDLQIVGHPNAVVAYNASAVGTFASNSGRVSLSDLGIATDSLQWTPPDELTIATLAIDSGYDEVAEGNQATLDVPVAKRFGHDLKSTGITISQFALLAIPIVIPVPCRTIDLGVRVDAQSANPTQALVGLYDDAGAKPGARRVATPAFAVPPFASPDIRTAIPIETDLEPGAYWLVVVTDRQTTIRGDSNNVDEASLTSSGSFALPDPFPIPTGTALGEWSIDVTVVAR